MMIQRRRCIPDLLVLACVLPLMISGLAAPGSKVELWNSGTCPYAQRAWIALVEKGIPFEFKKVDLQDKSADFEETYRRANPNPLISSKVPVMVVTDGEKSQVYTESKVVLEAIEELWPEPALLPSDSEGRAKCRLFTEAVYDVAFGGSRSAYQVALRKLDSEEGHGTFDSEAERKSLCESLAALDKSLQGICTNDDGPFLLGDFFSYAECMVAPFAQRADAILAHYVGMNVIEICKSEGYARAAAWWKAVMERESVICTGSSAEETIENSKRLLGMMRARQQPK